MIRTIFPAWLFLMAGCNAIAGIHDGVPYGGVMCTTLPDCTAAVEVPECRTAVACEKGRCVFQDAIEGTPLTQQIPGDCVEVACGGKGKSVQRFLATDAPDDGNPCTLDTCNGSQPAHEPVSWAACYSGPEGTQGIGICTAGVQQCDTQGNPVGPCEGEVFPQTENCASPFDDDCDGEANEEGLGCACKPGEAVPCYNGPPGTEGIGICHGGMQGCRADGAGYGPCIGEQGPGAEHCDAAMDDEDCDGEVNEEGTDCFSCGDGYVQPSLGEECDDGNLDSTDTCTADCKLATCGDSFVQPGESCDDGNTMDGDACPATCVRSAVQLATSNGHTCTLFEDGSVKCWGYNVNGQLGVGDTLHRGDQPNEMRDNLPAVDLGTGKTAVAIAAGGDHTCALLSDGSVKCWGDNQYGQLGLGDPFTRGDEPNEMGDNLPPVNLGTGVTAVTIDSGQQHNCARLSDGRVKCWGYNFPGQLGLGDKQTRGLQPSEMGDNLPAVDFGTGKSAFTIAAGSNFNCAILIKSSVKCWGSNSYGQLGLGNKSSRGDQPSEMGDYLPAVDLGTGKTAVQIAPGYEHACAILNDGHLKCWGRNDYGQLGLGDTSNRGDQPGEMGDILPAVDLGAGNTAIAVIPGGLHTCALLQDGKVKCWGDNSSGQDGQGDGIRHGDGPNEMGDNLHPIHLGTAIVASAISAGAGYSCAVVNGGRLKCWGNNYYGQLGLGDTLNRGKTPNDMGDNLPFVTP